jgi:hypothetical protein
MRKKSTSETIDMKKTQDEKGKKWEWKENAWTGWNRRKIGAFPILLITIGIIFLLQTFGIVPGAWGKLWPLILIALGLVWIFNALQKSNP